MDNTHPLHCETPTNAYVYTHTHTDTHGDAAAWALNVITLTSPQPSVTLHNPSCFGYLNTPCTPHMCTRTVGVINMHAETETDALLTVWGHNNQQSSVVNPSSPHPPSLGPHTDTQNPTDVFNADNIHNLHSRRC